MKVSISGHQNLGSTDDLKWVMSSLKNVIDGLKISQGYTCLAIGADQLFAVEMIKRNIPFTAILACKNIVSSFKNSEDKEKFSKLLSLASEVVSLPFEEPSEEAYYSAGKIAVDNSDVLIVIWNGLPAKGLGGTGDIVEYALSISKQIIHINNIEHTIT